MVNNNFRILFLCLIHLHLVAQHSYFLDTDHKYNDVASYDEVSNLVPLKTGVQPFVFSMINKERTQRSAFIDADKILYFLNDYEGLISDLSSNWSDSIRTLLFYRKTVNQWVSFSSFFSLNSIYKAQSTANAMTFKYVIKGQIKDWHFYADRSDISVAGNKSNYDVEHNYASISLSRGSSTDLSYGYTLYEITPKAYIYLGKIPWSIGMGESGKFVLDEKRNSPFTSTGFVFSLWKLSYHSTHGSLLASELKSTIADTMLNTTNYYRHIPDKFFVNHRFELNVTENLTAHYNETIIYGNRSIDLNYLNPFVFLRPQEHELHDRDNALITLGFKWRIPRLNLLTYHDFLLDEWRISEAFSDWFGNKHGIMNGLAWANHNFQLWFEHVAIRPFTYTHRFDVNRYTHDGQNLGYFAGPNSQTFYYKLAYYPNDSWRFWTSHRITHKGLNYEQDNGTTWNIGGDIFKGHTNENTGETSSIKDRISFLEGNVVTELETQFNVTYEPNYYIKTEFNYTYNSRDKNLLRFLFRIQY